MIKFIDVFKTYDTGVDAIRGINLTIDKGEFVFVVGPSGAGKSTLIKLLLHEQIATKGTVLVGDYNLSKLRRQDIPAYRRTIGVVFQDFRLIPTMTVYDNIAFALRVTNVSNKYIRRRVPYVLDLLGLSAKARCLPHEISGGEQQRVALARALVNNPSIIIADEPTGNIDPELSFQIVDLLTEINQCGTTILMVTHAYELVNRFDRRVIQLEKGQIVADKRGGYKLPRLEQRFEAEKEDSRVIQLASHRTPMPERAVRQISSIETGLAVSDRGDRRGK